MVPFLFVVSFILHLTTFFIIIILYQRTNLIDHTDQSAFEQMFQKYLDEIKKENNRLHEQLQTLEAKTKKQVDPQKSIIDDHESDDEPFLEPEQAVQDEVETSLTANILSLAEKGYTSNEIAKQLRCGKTEAELIINFYAKNNS